MTLTRARFEGGGGDWGLGHLSIAENPKWVTYQTAQKLRFRPLYGNFGQMSKKLNFCPKVGHFSNWHDFDFSPKNPKISKNTIFSPFDKWPSWDFRESISDPTLSPPPPLKSSLDPYIPLAPSSCFQDPSSESITRTFRQKRKYLRKRHRTFRVWRPQKVRLVRLCKKQKKHFVEP